MEALPHAITSLRKFRTASIFVRDFGLTGGATASRLVKGKPVRGRRCTRSRMFCILGHLHTCHWLVWAGKAAYEKEERVGRPADVKFQSPLMVSGEDEGSDMYSNVYRIYLHT